MKEIKTKVVGVSHKNTDGSSRQDAIGRFCKDGASLALRRDHLNKYDPFAVAVFATGNGQQHQIGFLAEELARQVSAHLDNAKTAYAKILKVTGGTKSQPTYGCNITVFLASI